MPDPELERIGARVAAQSLVLHALLDHLTRSGVLKDGDYQELREFCLTVARDLEAQSSTLHQVGGARTAVEVRSFFAALGLEE